jgi:hypothetical protein
MSGHLITTLLNDPVKVNWFISIRKRACPGQRAVLGRYFPENSLLYWKLCG